MTLDRMGIVVQMILFVQGDTERWPKPPVDFQTKVLLWPGLSWQGQAKTELLL